MFTNGFSGHVVFGKVN